MDQLFLRQFKISFTISYHDGLKQHEISIENHVHKLRAVKHDSS